MFSHAFRGARFLVTGASSGIGRAVSVELLARGALVAGLARRGERLAAVEGLIPCVADVTDPDQVDSAVALAVDRLGGLDGVVHAAGISGAGSYEEMHAAQVRLMHDVNVSGTTHVVRATVPVLRDSRSERRRKLVMVSSASVAAPSAFVAQYTATKAFQRGLADSLHYELRPHGIDVTCVLTGVVQTEITERSEGFPSALLKISRLIAISPERCAKRILRDAAAGRRRSWPNSDLLRIPGVARALSRASGFGDWLY